MSNNAEDEITLASELHVYRRRFFLKELTTPRSGGADRDRTDDLKLAKLALSQLSYGPDHPIVSGAIWWAREDLNFRPHAYQARALTN